MPLEPALKAMLVETVAHSAYTGQDAYGKPTYAAPINRPARVEYRTTTVTNAQGQERMSNTVVFLDGDFSITVRDKITLPDGTSPAIQDIKSPRHEDAPARIHHHECLL